MNYRSVESWDLIRAFIALYRKKSYQAAAEYLGVDNTTLRRRIDALEKVIGAPVFVREQGDWVPAPGKEPMIDAALAMESNATGFFTSSAQEKGALRVSMPNFCFDWLLPAFRRYQQAHPHIRLTLGGEARFVDLERDGVDFAIRLARPVRHMNNLRIKKLGDMLLMVYGSHDYFSRITGLNSHEIIGTSVDFAHRNHDFIYGSVDWGELGVEGEVIALIDDLGASAKLCSQGVGIALLPVFVAEAFSNLTPLTGITKSLSAEVWLVSRLNMRERWQSDLIDILSEEWRRVLSGGKSCEHEQ